MQKQSLAHPNAMPRRMMPVVLLAQAAKHLGLGKQVTKIALRRLLSSDRIEQAFDGYRPTAQDVFVATFGKSGTNWMMQIAQQITWRGHADFAHIHDVVPWPDSPMPLPFTIFDPHDANLSPTGLRVIKTHLAADHVPYSTESTYLTVLRDPKEVLVSSYYFLGGLLGMLSHVTIDDWFDLFARSDAMAGRWARHTASFWAWRDRSNALVLGYREIIEQPRESIARVATKMGVELRPEELDQVVERSSFEYMKAHESQFAPPKPLLTKDADRPKMVRSGRAGASDEALGRAQQAELDRLCQAELKRLGSDFPYAEMFDVVVDPGDRWPTGAASPCEEPDERVERRHQ